MQEVLPGPSAFLVGGGVIKTRKADINFEEHKTGYSYTGPPYFVKHRNAKVTTTTVNTTTTINDVYETDIIEYSVDTGCTQTSFERDDHGTPVGSAPRASHVEIEFEKFDQRLLRASTIRDDTRAIVPEVVYAKNVQSRIDAYQMSVAREPSNSSSDERLGSEPHALLMDYFNEIHCEASKAPNAPKLVTPISYKCVHGSVDSLEISPALIPCVGTYIDSGGIADIPNHWHNAILFIDVRPAESPAFPSASSVRNVPLEVAIEPINKRGKRKRDGSIHPEEPAARRKSPAPVPAKLTSRGSRRRSVTPNETMQPQAPPIPEAPSLPTVTEALELSEPVPLKNQSFPNYVQEDFRMSRYALEALNDLGNRRFVLGLLVKGFELWFYYFDRAGSIRSTSLHLLRDTETVVATIINLSRLSAQQLGLQAFDVPDPHIPRSTFNSIRDCEISVEGMRYSIFDLIHRSRNLYGRGTIVFSAFTKRRPVDQPEKDQDRVLYDESMDDEARTAAEKEHVEKEEKKARLAAIPQGVAIKLTWQLVSQDPDDKLFDIVRERGVKNVLQLHGSRVAGRLSDGIRDSLVTTEWYQDRVLRVQIFGPICEPIYRVSDVNVFKRAFIGCVKAHRELFAVGSILHRDISPNNLMCIPHEECRGVLIDLDHAIQTDGYGLVDEKVDTDSLPPAIHGTPGFMANDLIATGGPPTMHLYRHDLESFYYSLVWIVTHYRRGRLIWTDELADWTSGDALKVIAAKRAFMAAREPYPYRWRSEITDLWLPRLSKLFSEAFKARGEAGTTNEPFDDETLGGYITFETFLDALERPA